MIGARNESAWIAELRMFTIVQPFRTAFLLLTSGIQVFEAEKLHLLMQLRE